MEHPLFDATITNDVEALAAQLAAGADVNMRDEDGFTPLMSAIGHDNKEAALFLLDNGADPNIQDTHGWTALMHAARLYRVEIVAALLAAGADKTIENNDGNTAFQICLSKGIRAPIMGMVSPYDDAPLDTSTDKKPDTGRHPKSGL